MLEKLQFLLTAPGPGPYKGSLMFRSPGAIAFQLGPLTIRWYGILMATAMAVGLLLAYREAKQRGIDPDELLKTSELALLAGLIGARLYYVAFNWEYYSQVPLKIVAVWEGGLAIHGGLLGGLLVGSAYAWWKRLPLVLYLDITAPSLTLGQAIGRWGNFFNEEAFGTPTTLPWKLYISPPHRPLEYAQAEYFHPTFLYESAWDFVVFSLLMFFLRRRLARARGSLFLAYVGLYSVGRFFVEGLRTDSLMLGPIRVAQLVSGAAIAVSLVGLVILLKRPQSG